MLPFLQLTLSVALLMGCDLVSAQARSGGTPPEDRWNPQHLSVLPVEIRNAIAPYARVCGGPLGRTFVRALFPKRDRETYWPSF
jgi:hypothetical protein